MSIASNRPEQYYNNAKGIDAVKSSRKEKHMTYIAGEEGLAPKNGANVPPSSFSADSNGTATDNNNTPSDGPLTNASHQQSDYKTNNYLITRGDSLKHSSNGSLGDTGTTNSATLGQPHMLGRDDSEDGQIGNSFWDVGQFKRTVKRIEDSYKLCTDYYTMMQERGYLEESYAKSLRAWSKKWAERVDKGTEYGSMQRAWRFAASEETDRLAAIHLSIRDNLVGQVLKSVKEWQKESYHKTVVPINQIKEAKEMDEIFRKAQKPWAKLFKKVSECKKAYHLACKLEKTASVQESNARADLTKSPDEQKRMREKVERCTEEVSKSRERYQTALHELNAYNPKYVEDMREIFEKCQRVEEARMSFFKQILYIAEQNLNPLKYEDLPKIYEDYRQTIDAIDIPQDLALFSNNYGVGTSMNWPLFEEYSPELHAISKKGGLRPMLATSGALRASRDGDLDNGCVTLKSIVHKDLPSSSPTASSSSPIYDNNSHYNQRTTTNHQQNYHPQQPCYQNRPLPSTKSPIIDRGGGVQLRRLHGSNSSTGSKERENYTRSEYIHHASTTGHLGERVPQHQSYHESNHIGDHGESVVPDNIDEDNRDVLATSRNPQEKQNIYSLQAIDQIPVQTTQVSAVNVQNTQDDVDGTKVVKQPKKSNASSLNNGDYETITHTLSNPSSMSPRDLSSRVSDYAKRESINNFHGANSADHYQIHQDRTSLDQKDSHNMHHVGHPHGIPVRALYDYEAQEVDELSFKKGTLFFQLSGKDDQGWAKGQLPNSGKEGLYPAEYVKPV